MKALLVIGDALLDVDLEGHVTRSCPDAPAPVVDEQRTLCRPGGAALAAALAAADGREVTLITALGKDDAGALLARLLTARRVDVVDLGLDGETPQKVRVRDGGRTLLRIDYGGDAGGAAVGRLTASARAAIGWAEATLVSDYGRGLAADLALRRRLQATGRGRTLVWDPHPRGPDPVAGATLATPNRVEAEALALRMGGAGAACSARGAACSARGAASEESLASCGRLLARRWRAHHVCVTCSASGALLCGEGPAHRVAAPFVAEGDPCGAGDRFAVSAAGALADGADTFQAVRAGVRRASEFVLAGGAGAWASPSHRVARAAGPSGAGASGEPSAQRLAEAIRAEGGTVVATGGCFDLLHAGHIGTLEAARALGDCLIVCLNSDASVSRLKGPRRPLVGERDRARVLAALTCVDAVMTFEEDTPERVLRELRPDIWAKGGDYDARQLAERAAVVAAGGRTVILPYLDGRSTSGLLREVTGGVGS